MPATQHGKKIIDKKNQPQLEYLVETWFIDMIRYTKALLDCPK